MIARLLRRPDYLLEYAFTYAFMFAAQALPLDWALGIGAWAGGFVRHFTRRSFRVGVANVMSAYPGKTRAQAERLIVAVYRHFGRASAEVAIAFRKITPRTWTRHVTVRNGQVIDRVRGEGKGAIWITAHLGPWELLALVMRFRDIPLSVVYRPAGNPLVDRLVRRRRLELGQRLIERKGAVPALLRTLRRGGYIALVADQHVRRDGVATPFFGRPAVTTMAPALLAIRTGAPIVVGWIRRRPGMYRFEAVFEEPIYADPNADREAEALRLTAEMTRRIEAAVRQQPDQWLWMHRRWRADV